MLAIILYFAACKQHERAVKIPLEAFFRNSGKSSFQISPDGKQISYVQNQLLYVQDLDGKKGRNLTKKADRIIGYYWANNDMLFYRSAARDKRGERLIAVYTNGKPSQELLPRGRFKISLINPTRIKDNTLFLALNLRDSGLFDAYKLDIAAKKLSLVFKNPGNITEWYVDDDNQLRLAVASDGVNKTLMFRENSQDKFKPVITTNFKTNIKPVGFCRQNKSCIYALSNYGRDKMAIVEFNCLTGKEEKEIFSHKDVDVVEAGYSTKRRGINYAVFETWKKQRIYLNDSAKSVYQKLEKLLPNTEINILSRDSAEKKLIINTFTDVTPGVFYLYTLATNKLLRLSEPDSALSENNLCPMKPQSFKNREGFTINGYLTVPKGSSGKDLPVVVIPHSIAESRNSWGFNSEVQFLANRGYAVFQMNFRGSTGYGKEFYTAGFKKWGTAIQDDITDGVKWLIDSEIADPKRIAIYGTSFGGYSALEGLSLHPELYACGVSYSGFTNLFTFIKSVPPYYKPYQQMFYEKVGNPETDADYFRAYSPIFHTDRIKAPILIAQGTKDPRVNVNETNQFVRELKKRGVLVTYILKQNEGHSFRKQENRQDFYRQLEKFLAEHLTKH
ncbi:MAG: peptidase prolyl oligopeptidase active site domain protein [Sphingobacteriaceae bacterium]|nr:peptidase prolyl oligopeptidase active site domain protein [Sphingobacteriaceae bacterium]